MYLSTSTVLYRNPDAHTYLLGPIMGQLDLRSQLYVILDFYGTRLDLTTILYV